MVVQVGDEQAAGAGAAGDGHWEVQLAVAAAVAPERAHGLARRRQERDAVVVLVRHGQPAVAGPARALRAVELAGAAAPAPHRPHVPERAHLDPLQPVVAPVDHHQLPAPRGHQHGPRPLELAVRAALLPAHRPGALPGAQVEADDGVVVCAGDQQVLRVEERDCS